MAKSALLVIICAPLALALGFMAMSPENHLPWTIAFFSYVALAGLVASSYGELYGDRSIKFGAGLLAVIWVIVVAITLGYLGINRLL